MPSSPQFDPNSTPDQRAASSHSKFKRVRNIIFCTALTASATALIAPHVNGQDLGEIARQERAKKQNNPAPSPTHVYTNEDMQRQQILTPEDQSRFSATTKPAPAKPAESPIQVADKLTPPPASQPNAQPAHSPGNADLPIGARPLISSTTRAKTNSAPATILIASAAYAPTPIGYENFSLAFATNAKTVATETRQPNTIKIRAATSQPTHSTATAPAKPSASTAASNPQIITVTETVPAAQPTVPLNQMPLGDVARYYREIKRLSLQVEEAATAKPVPNPGPVPTPPAQSLSEIIPTTISLHQMPLGDIAPYYRAQKRLTLELEEAEALSNQASPSSASSISPTPISASTTSPPSMPSADLGTPNTSPSPYPLTLAATPLASMKPPPPRARKSHSSPTMPKAHHPIAHPTTARTLAGRTRSVTGQTASIRITSGDTLWQLARHYLGSATRWPELLALNPTIQNPKRLQVGTQLALLTPAV